MSERAYRELKERAAKGSPSASAQPAAAPPAETPTGAVGLSGAAGPFAAVTTNFEGINELTGGTFPPDTTAAKSPNRVLEGVNKALRLSSTTGGEFQTLSLTSFFSSTVGSTGFTYDPKVYFDRNAANPRFYVVALEKSGEGDFNSANDFSRIHFAVSRSSDPSTLSATGWCHYFIDGVSNRGTSDQGWADYDGLGVGADALIITTNQFKFAPPGTHTFSLIRVINKLVLANNASSCPSASSLPFFEWGPPATTETKGDTNTFTLQPVQQYTSPSSFSGTTNPAYLISTKFGESNAYRVWRIRNVASGSPTLQRTTVLGSFTYAIPPQAPGGATGPPGDGAPGSTAALDTGDTRTLQAAGIGNALSASHTTRCQFSSPTPVACARVVRLLVGQSSGGGVIANLSQQTVVWGGGSNYFFLPGIAVSTTQRTGIVFQWSSPTQRLSTLASVKELTSSDFTSTAFVGPGGTCLLQNNQTSAGRNSVRVGDYTGAQLDPSDLSSFWLAGERATPLSGSCQWQTSIGKLTP